MVDVFDIIGIVCVVLGVLGYCLYRYVVKCGLNHIVKFEKKAYPLEECLILYKYGRGTQDNVGGVFNELKRIVPGLKTIGIYYDDKNTVKAEDNRWAIGAIVAEGRSTIPDPIIVQRLMNWGYKRHRLPTADIALMTTVPHKSFVSVLLTYKQVWKTLAKYYKDNPKLPKSKVWIDIFANKEATYMGLLDRNIDDFYVLETTEVVDDEDSKAKKKD